MYQLEPRANVEIPATLSETGLEIDERTIARERAGGPGRDVRVEDDGATIVYTSERNAVFEITNGERIAVDPASLGSREEIGLNLLGPLFRLVLLQRGEFVLHASVVRIGARTAMFIAPSGHGKSTMAAGLYDRGHGVVSDDVGIVRLESGPSTLAGPPVLKLHAKSAAHIHRAIEPVFSDGLESGKRFYRLPDNEVPDRTLLDSVYLIERGDAIELEPVSARDATIAFVQNSWGLPGRDETVAAQNLRQCSKLADTVAVRRVRYPRSFEGFEDVLTRIEEDCNDGRC